MTIDIDGTISAVKAHLDAYRFPAADALVDSIIAHLDRGETSLSADEIKNICKHLRGARQFETLGRIARALMRAGHDEPGTPAYAPHVRRQYAQSLIEAGQLPAAIDTLECGLVALSHLPPSEGARFAAEREEMLGLLGRANKQIYVDIAAAGSSNAATGAAFMRNATRSYGAAALGRAATGAHWPLINMIAMAARAERDGLPRPFGNSAHALAAEAVASLLPVAASATPADPGDQPWLRASLGEAFVALQDWPNATKWYSAFAADPSVSAFALASARRQLVEVWQIDPDSRNGDGNLVRQLDFALASKPGGAIRLSKAARDLALDDGLIQQSILDQKNPPYRIVWLRGAFERARSVAGVVDESRDRVYGTAFLVNGRDLHPSFGDEPLAITAAHVVSSLGMLMPSEAILRFEEHSGPNKEFEVEGLFVSPPSELDFCVLKLKRKPDGLTVSTIRAFDTFPDRIEELGPAARACSTIGHAFGRDLSISLANSELLDIGYKRPDRRDQVFLRYTTSTEGGNSGGPVYDKDWNVIGLHRAGIRSDLAERGIPCLCCKPELHVANEGVALKSIAREFQSSWISPPVAVSMPAGMQSKWQQLEAAILSQDAVESTIETLFENMEADDFPGAPQNAADPNGVAPEAANVADQFWYGGAVALSKAFRIRRNYHYAQTRARNVDGISFVSEGDSWFQFPVPRVRDVIDHLDNSYPIYCRAIAGTLFEDMFADTTDLMAAIRDYRPNGVLLSGGGNDLLGNGKVAAYVLDYREGRPPAALLNPVLDRKIGLIIELFDQLVDRALAIDPALKFFVHGYDWALPRRGGGWLNQPLKSQHNFLLLTSQKQVVAAIVDRFNDKLAAFAASHPGIVHYVDCRGTVGTTSDDWYDELHPRSPGFGRVAAEFNRAIRHAFKDHPSIKRDLRNLGRGGA